MTPTTALPGFGHRDDALPCRTRSRSELALELADLLRHPGWEVCSFCGFREVQAPA